MTSLEERYKNLVQKKTLIFDPKQLEIIQIFDNFIDTYKASSSKNIFQKFFQKNASSPIKGFYIYGEVGRGKTMMMDLFHNYFSDLSIRVHFHDFMKDIHKKLEETRLLALKNPKKNIDAIKEIATNLRKKANIIFFDEFTVTDIADAMILGRLFSKLFELGLIFVATSNVPPQDLYKNGLNRQLFLPFIQILINHVNIINLDAPLDYRTTKTLKDERYFFPLSTEVRGIFENLWQQNLKKEKIPPQHQKIFEINKRKINFPFAFPPYLRLSFQDLNEKQLAANDFLELCSLFHTFFLSDVPLFDDEMRNAIKRLILFVDVLYDQQALLYMSAQDLPQNLYKSQSAFTENFEFQRTISRITEMQSKEYLQKHIQKFQ